MNLTHRLALISALFFVPLAAAHAQHGLTPADTLRMAVVADAQVAPDGERVVYTVTTVEGREPRTRLWYARRGWRNVGPGDEAPRPLLSADWTGPTNPRWSPDGRLVAFLATREGQTGLYVVNVAGDRAPRLVANVRQTNFFITYADEPFAWAPDSRRVAFINASEPEATGAGGAAGQQRADPVVVERLQYKARTALADQLRTHVWLVDVDNPVPRQLTSGATYDHALAFSPRGDEIAFVSNHEPDPDANNNSDIYVVGLDGRMRQLTTTRGSEYQPAWSPDGKWLAYVATKRDVTTIDSVAEDTHVWLVPADGGQAGRELTGAFDRRATHPRWSGDSRRIYFLANDRGRSYIYGVSVAGGPVRSLFAAPEPPPDDRGAAAGSSSVNLADGRTGAGDADSLARYPDSSTAFQVGSFSVQRTAIFDTFAFTLSTAVMPAEVWTLRVEQASGGGSAPRRISAHNAQFVRSFALVAPDVISFKSFDDTPVEGWLLKPVGWHNGQRAPLVLSIHGGPHGMYGYGFNASLQAYAAAGYAVLYLNPRGSNGYGQKFSDGTLREWGGGDYKDLMAGVDEALRRYPWLDQNRMAVTGGSYGGFMTNWIITQTPRFRAAVASASVANLISFYATSLYQDLVHAEFGGLPWDDYDLLWRWSPLRYARDVQTPTLFLHGEQDNDVHITQAEEMYMALRRRNVDTVLVRYPREGHGLREPGHRQDALERTLAWFDKYLK